MQTGALPLDSSIDFNAEARRRRGAELVSNLKTSYPGRVDVYSTWLVEIKAPLRKGDP